MVESEDEEMFQIFSLNRWTRHSWLCLVYLYVFIQILRRKKIMISIFWRLFRRNLPDILLSFQLEKIWRRAQSITWLSGNDGSMSRPISVVLSMSSEKLCGFIFPLEISVSKAGNHLFFTRIQDIFSFYVKNEASCVDFLCHHAFCCKNRQLLQWRHAWIDQLQMSDEKRNAMSICEQKQLSGRFNSRKTR